MKKLLKRILSIFLSVVLLLSIAPAAKLANLDFDSVLSTEAEATFSLSDYDAQRFVDLFYSAGTELSDGIYDTLTGKKEGTYEEFKSIFSNAAAFYGVIQNTNFDDIISSAASNALSNVSSVVDCVSGVIGIVDNIESFATTDSSMKRVIDGMQIGVNALTIIGLGSFIPASVSFALSILDVTVCIAGYLESKYFEENVGLYRYELDIAYFTGGELPKPNAPKVNGYFGLTQEEADGMYNAVYLEYFIKRLIDCSSSNNGTVGNSGSGSAEVSKIVFSFDEYTLFMNTTIRNTAIAYPINASERDIIYTSQDTTIAKVNTDGTIIPVAPGTVYIFAENGTRLGTSSGFCKSDNGIVSTCKITILPFEVKENNNKITITKYVGNEPKVEIPKHANNVSIVEIGQSAFSHSSVLSSLSIPNSVTSIGASAFWDCSNLTSVTIPDSVTSIGDSAFNHCTNLTSITIPDSIVNIGNSVFNGCSSLTSITIPDSVTSIGASAFDGCTRLTCITIPDSVTTIGDAAFGSCSSLTRITIPDSVTSIGGCAFANCTGLTSIKLSKNLRSIGTRAFVNCTSLASIIIPDSVTSIGEHDTFSGCNCLTTVTIGNSVMSICDYAFNDCFNLTNLIIGNNVKNIDSFAFKNCSKLTEISIPDSVTNISDGAFDGCSSLKNIIIGNNVTDIYNYAFAGCSELKNVTIGNKVKNIGEYAFAGCTELTIITLPDSVTSIGKYAFARCTRLTSITMPKSITNIGEAAFSLCTELTSITLPDGITNIGNFTFSDCQKLTSISIPKSVSCIGYAAFRSCTGLTSVSIPKGLTNIDNYAFCGCTELKNISIPDSVTNIGEGAFSECTGLTNIIIPDSVINIGDGAFSYCKGLTSIYVDSNNTVYDGRENCNAIIETATNTLIQGCKNTTIPDSVTSIGNCAFRNCTSLTSITIPDSVTSIGNYAFRNCTQLKIITIPDSVTSIGGRILENCESVRIICCENSTAHKYAVDNSIPYAFIDDLIDFSASTLNFDYRSHLVYGFENGVNSLNGIKTLDGYTYQAEYDGGRISTGSKISVNDENGNSVYCYEAVIFGDVNGDGWYDGADAMLVNCLLNGLLTREQVGEAVWAAADCNHDGVIDELDVALLERAGLLLSQIDQSKSESELLESDAYIEYQSLIDQSPEPQAAEPDITPDPEPETEPDIFEQIASFIKQVVEFILSFVKRLYK